jgi:hypothetical protein
MDRTGSDLAENLAFEAAGRCRPMPLGANSIGTDGVDNPTEGSVDGGGGGNRTRVPEEPRTKRLRV